MEKETETIEKAVREYVSSEQFINMAIQKTKAHISNKKRYEKDPLPGEVINKLADHLESTPSSFIYLSDLSASLWNNYRIKRSSRSLKKELTLIHGFKVKIAGDARKNAVFLS